MPSVEGDAHTAGGACRRFRQNSHCGRGIGAGQGGHFLPEILGETEIYAQPGGVVAENWRTCSISAWSSAPRMRRVTAIDQFHHKSKQPSRILVQAGRFTPAWPKPRLLCARSPSGGLFRRPCMTMIVCCITAQSVHSAFTAKTSALVMISVRPGRITSPRATAVARRRRGDQVDLVSTVSTLASAG